MKIILLQDLPNIGRVGELLEVKEGFARNYLLPQGLAEIPSGKTVQKVIAKKKEKIAAEEKRKLDLEEAVKLLDGSKLTLKVKINSQGHLYKAVTKKDLAMRLNVESRLIEDINLKSVGEFKVKIKVGSVASVIILEIRPEK